MSVKGRALVIADGVPALDLNIGSLKTGFKSALKGQITLKNDSKQPWYRCNDRLQRLRRRELRSGRGVSTCISRVYGLRKYIKARMRPCTCCARAHELMYETSMLPQGYPPF